MERKPFKAFDIERKPFKTLWSKDGTVCQGSEVFDENGPVSIRLEQISNREILRFTIALTPEDVQKLFLWLATTETILESGVLDMMESAQRQHQMLLQSQKEVVLSSGSP